MSDLKISPNLFLEVNELNRLKKTLRDDGYVRLIKSMVKTFGIVKNSSNGYFKVNAKAGTADHVIINAGLAFNSDLEAIVLESDLELIIANTGTKRWIILSAAVSNYEIGTVSVSATGALTGIGTEFTKVLRGQPNFPTKMKLYSSSNLGDYEVVSVNSDTSAVIAGSFISESNLKYGVIGTFTPGFQPATNDKMIYEYDYHNISIVDSANEPSVTSNQFILASVEFITGVMTVVDKRDNCIFNSSTSLSGQNVTKVNPLVSLKRTAMIEIRRLEFLFEHGYTISAYELIPTSISNTFVIQAGTSNFLGSGDIPDNFFNGWILLNRKNMRYSVIESNSNKNLYVPIIDSTMIELTGNDFVVVPDYSEIEYEISLSGEDSRKPIYKRVSMQNIFTRIDIPIESGTSQVKMRYRMINSNADQTTFNDLAIAQFQNVDGVEETLANSSFSVMVADVQPLIRNYS